MKTQIITFLLSLSILISCQTTKEENQFVEEDIVLQKREATQVESDNNFGIELFQNIAKEKTKNIMVSPFSVYQALLMAYNGADGQTKEEFAQLLNAKDISIDELNKTHQKLSSSLVKHDSKVLFSIANSVWYDNNFLIKDAFIDVNKEYYNAEVSKLDFSKEATLHTINDWVADNTNQKIKKILDKISPDEVLFLINAIYFKADWQYQFDKSLTEEKTFYTSNNNAIEVPMMTTEASLNWANNNYGQIVELPYGRGKFSMLLILPKEGVDELILGMTTSKVNDWIQEMNSYKIKVKLPKFEFSYKTMLNETLQQMGLLQAFQDNANFSKISDVSIQISKVLHKTYIKTDEEGSEAAAVTSVGFGITSVGPNQTMNITFNKPFVFIIREKDTNTILFAGKVENPLEKE